MTGGDTKRIFESKHLGEAGQHQQCNNRGQLVCRDAVGRQYSGEGLELGGAEAPGVAGDLDAYHFAVVRQSDEHNREGGTTRIGVEPP